MELGAVVEVPAREELTAIDEAPLHALTISENPRPHCSLRTPILGNDVLRSCMVRFRKLMECVAQMAGRDTQGFFVAGSRVKRVLLEVTRVSTLVPAFNSVEEAFAHPLTAAERNAEDLIAKQSQKLWSAQ